MGLAEKMKIIDTKKEMREWAQAGKREGKKIAFVPTMGALHKGHLSLLEEGKKRCDLLVLSIFVNPMQFGPNEDLEKYPRDLDGDIEKAESCGVDAVFIPDSAEIYPHGFQTYLNVEEVTKNLCGASRHGHFRGVATVVAKLFNIVMPDAAIFGEKDFQQLVMIKRMVQDLDMPIEIVGCPTIREMDGLAMSSRNRCLLPAERQAALSISKSLDLAEVLVEKGETKAGAVTAQVRQTISSSGMLRVDYVRIVDAETLTDVSTIKKPALLAIAAYVGKTRLIDNRLFL